MRPDCMEKRLQSREKFFRPATNFKAPMQDFVIFYAFCNFLIFRVVKVPFFVTNEKLKIYFFD